MRHRPIGIGVQGLADAFILMRYPFESPEAQQLNKDIFETIYFAALDASCELAEKFGTYETYPGCPVSKGVRMLWESCSLLFSLKRRHVRILKNRNITQKILQFHVSF